MTRQYFPWCPCCGQCTRRYNFDDSLGSMDVAQFRAYDDPGGTTPVTVYWDYGAEELDIEGEGCYAVEIIPASVTLKTIHVAAMVAALTTGGVGVTIRRPESDESISLWWLGGTSYELRHGTTVIETITHTAATDEIKLELTTPKDPTTDVLVYIGGALVHTETAVAFVMPDVLNLGVAIDGEATVDWVEVSPCPPVCGTSSDCDAIAGVPIPKIWTVEVPSTTDSGSGCTGYCASFAGTFRLLARKEVSVLEWFDDGATPQPLNWYWRTSGVSFFDNPFLGDFYCSFIQIRDTKEVDVSYWMDHDPFVYGQPENTIDPTTWPIDARLICADPAHPPFPYTGLSSGGTAMAWVLGFELDPINPTANYRLSLVTFYRKSEIAGIAEYGVKYSSAYYLTNDPTPLQGGPITLNLDGSLDGSPLVTGCTFPASVTVTPGTDAEFMGRLCETGCTPPVTPQPGSCYLINITLADEDGGDWDYSLPLGLQYDEDSGSWYWEGGSLSAYPYVHDTCGPLPEFDIKIHCVEPEEGASKQWVMDFTTSGGSDRYPMAWFDVEETIPEFEGTTDLMCSGQTWDLYAFNLRLETTEYQFGSCGWSACATPTSPIILADISASCSGESGSGGASGPLVFQASSSLPVGVDPGDVSGLSFWSPLPSSLNTGILKMAFLYVENGTAKIQITDGAGNPIPDMSTTVAYSCDPSDDKPAFVDTSETLYDWGFPGPYTANQFGLCDGESSGFGGWEVTFP